MAKRNKGEISLEHDGKAYTLLIDFNALADFEDAAQVDNALAILQSPENLGARMTRALFWAGLRQHHPELTMADAGRIMSANPDKLGEALAAGFGSADGDEGNAPAAKAGRR